MKILMSLVFYPRGGSAQVARYLSRSLIGLGHEVRLVTGTLRDGDAHHDAESFFDEIPLTTVDYSDAWQGFQQGENPFSPKWTVPFHPSYEDKPGVPDRVFYSITDSEYEGLVRCWVSVFEEVRREFEPDLLHLHHLTHAHRAAAEVFPSVPKLTQLHGTEIKMLERLDGLRERGKSPPNSGRIGREMLSDGVGITDHFAAISPDIRDRATNQLRIPDSEITTIPNGVDTSLFQPVSLSADQKLQFLRRILVDDPQGWAEDDVPGSIRYNPDELERFRDETGRMKPLVMFVGRFLDFKRVPMLVRAVLAANLALASDGDPPFNLLVWGGMPGEWEGEHPHTVATSLKLSNVFFSGWLPHSVLSEGLALADLLVAPSYNEPFGQVFIEAMAAGLPVIATRSGGPLDFVVEAGPQANGWLCEVDDERSLAETLMLALGDAAERERRGANAMRLIREEYDWTVIAQRYAEMYASI